MISGPSQFFVVPKNVLLPGVVLRRAEHVAWPSCCRSCGRSTPWADGGHVVLGVVADAEREQLHQLAGEVLVRRALHVVPLERYSSIAGSSDISWVSVRKLPSAMVPVQLVLAHHQVDPVDAVPERADEVAVPEQRHLLLERAGDG